ncbi:hypothetical protein CCP3SC1AL1_1160002 [Gammaproteobacteria bacterium]
MLIVVAAFLESRSKIGFVAQVPLYNLDYILEKLLKNNEKERNQYSHIDVRHGLFDLLFDARTDVYDVAHVPRSCR